MSDIFSDSLTQDDNLAEHPIRSEDEESKLTTNINIDNSENGYNEDDLANYTNFIITTSKNIIYNERNASAQSLKSPPIPKKVKDCKGGGLVGQDAKKPSKCTIGIAKPKPMKSNMANKRWNLDLKACDSKKRMIKGKAKTKKSPKIELEEQPEPNMIQSHASFIVESASQSTSEYLHFKVQEYVSEIIDYSLKSINDNTGTIGVSIRSSLKKSIPESFMAKNEHDLNKQVSSYIKLVIKSARASIRQCARKIAQQPPPLVITGADNEEISHGVSNYVNHIINAAWFKLHGDSDESSDEVVLEVKKKHVRFSIADEEVAESPKEEEIVEPQPNLVLPPIRPTKFEAGISRSYYSQIPPLSHLPRYPKLGFPLTWGVALRPSELRHVLVGYTCPSVAKLSEEQLSNQTAATLRRYYSKQPCVKNAEWLPTIDRRF